ncbi:hypothetical protein [Neobacillus niacini]|uniref:hypothetical protein n=1 Tax=Neobacillus niacini TaxID=86668 RepID=UPI0021CB79DC|nr:hypothetical protein [Neobacillus niacini]MCM3763387.1 hypothetical protein [Neobacillus niacini]
MFEDFDINPVFEGTAREHRHFSLNVKGNQYKGMIHGDKVHWYNPHPKQSLEEEHVDAIESKVMNMMSDYAGE